MIKKSDVLVIDDEQVVLDAICRICGAEDYSVDLVTDADQGLKKINKNGFRLVLCDLMLPDMDGFRFLEILNDMKIDIPVIMMTGFSTMENAVKSLNQGAIDFIPKPFTADELCSVINRGFEFLNIREKERNRLLDSINYVPCPPDYYRLGYISWLLHNKGGDVLIGVTDLFLRTIKQLQGIDLMQTQEEIVQGSYAATLKSLDGLEHPIMAPISGRIMEVNASVIKSYALLEKDPFFKGWLYRILPSDFNYEIKNLSSCKINMT